MMGVLTKGVKGPLIPPTINTCAFLESVSRKKSSFSFLLVKFKDDGIIISWQEQQQQRQS